ncbi:MarR family winged helix-turn-helix transcriptional regulator [Thalassotalea fonticola]|uniref:MarR family winged helix-turn-helix transcriptional regulator n=1 Tax=Thalassotalea fonticola TaxID=3065649 RepID=A0ABZ0GK60_9GAMM|nr:MarR family winged helix-turn-helix transcriptional regulator [Colwelliaceae bacterium S1-1]
MTTANDGTLSLQQFLPYRLSALANRISQSLAIKYSKQYGISVQEWRILAVLGEGTKLSAVAITNRIAMDKVAVSRAVKRLIEKGLVIKHLDSKDQRSHELALSNEGIEMYQQLVPIALEHEQQVTDNLTLKEQQSLLKLLSKLDNAPL